MPLVTTSDGARLNESAAASYELLNRAFFARFGKRLYISSGARTHAEQVQAFTDNHQLTPILNNGRYITRKWNGLTWYLKPGKATVAVPGTSMHEYPPGRAADFGSGVATQGSAEHNWMIQNAGSYGWVWTGAHFVTIEPWHWEHISGSSSGGGTVPEGFLMALTDTQQAELYNGVSALYAAIFGPNGTVTSLPNATNLPTAVETIRLAVASLQRYNFAGGADVKNGIGATESMFGLLLQQKAQIAALTSAVTALAPGSGLSEETLRAIIDDSVKTAFEGVIIDDPDVNVEEIAAAVRDEFRKDPLS